MPYRIDIPCPPADALDRLVELGALDVESVGGGLAAILPDGVSPEDAAGKLGVAGVAVSAASGRDNGSVWMLSLRAIRIGGILIAPPGAATQPNALRISDSHAFGTGHHPTTALCIEALEEILSVECVDSILDVGIGSGILALAALKMGVPHAAGLDIDAEALEAAAENARLNGVGGRLRLVLGGPDAVDGTWPLVVANVLAAPLIEIAPALVRRLARGGRLILSGMPWGLESEVRQAYQRLGLVHTATLTRAGWTALVARTSW
jgi:ribosomal protein L11 methyltransferase